ncbi:hypothetical protein SRABI76_01358 [Microbacterium oxydans]|nr:hypothetical protein SRABI76_01358 [Microbacterium oxydans]
MPWSSSVLLARSGVQREESARPNGSPNEARTLLTSPIAPSRAAKIRSRYAGLNRIHMASIANRPLAAAALAICRPCSALTAIGFSMSTCLPASSAAIAIAACVECGVAM